MTYRLQQRRGTAIQWSTANPTIAVAEIGLETDTGKFKIGNGTTAWNLLPYADDGAKSYVDELLGDQTIDGTSGNTVTDRISQAIDALIDAAPSTLDTLNELAAALNDDNNFATTITNSIAAKSPIGHTHTLSEITDYVEPASTTVSETPPLSPLSGDIWFNSETGKSYIYYDSFWVQT